MLKGDVSDDREKCSNDKSFSNFKSLPVTEQNLTLKFKFKKIQTDSVERKKIISQLSDFNSDAIFPVMRSRQDVFCSKIVIVG